MQTYLGLESGELGRGLAGLGRGEGGSASNKGGEGSKLEHGWIKLVSIEIVSRSMKATTAQKADGFLGSSSFKVQR